MSGYFIGINIGKQLLFGFAWYMGGISVSCGPFSVEVWPHNYGKGDFFSFYNAFKEQP